MKILVFALSGIGDALMFSPALRILRAQAPQARIELVAMFKGVADLYERNPDVDVVHFRDFLKANPFASLLFLLRLRRARFDASINVYPSNRWPYNVISFLAGARRRLGHDYLHVNLRSLNFLNNQRVVEDDTLHNVEENGRLVELLGARLEAAFPALQVALRETDVQQASEWLSSQEIRDDELVVGFHAGSALFKNHIHKRWGAEKFGELGKQLAERMHARVLLFGGPEEYALNDRIASLIGERGSVVKVPTLITGVAIMKRCNLFVTNDSGLMHLAAGLQLPTVSIFAYTSPVKVRPWSVRHILVRRDLECSPCFYFSPRPASCVWNEDTFRCITHITVEEVYAAAASLLREDAGTRR